MTCICQEVNVVFPHRLVSCLSLLMKVLNFVILCFFSDYSIWSQENKKGGSCHIWETKGSTIVWKICFIAVVSFILLQVCEPISIKLLYLSWNCHLVPGCHLLGNWSRPTFFCYNKYLEIAHTMGSLILLPPNISHCYKHRFGWESKVLVKHKRHGTMIFHVLG